MPVNTLSAALVSLLILAAPAVAAPISAEIEGHNVHSQFLSGAFVPLPSAQTQGTGTTPFAPPADTVTPDAFTMLLGTRRSLANPSPQVDITPEQPPGSFESGTSDSIGGGGGSDPGTGVGTVPLPGALPMFGLALPILCGCGARQKRRVSLSDS